MKILNPPITTLLAAFGFACLSSCAEPAGFQTARMSTSSTPGETSLSQQVFREVNGYRHKRSKRALIHHAGLAGLARTHAQYLRRHRGKEGIRGDDANHHGFGSRAGKARYAMGFRKVAENVVACQGGGGSTYVRLWSQSPTHEKTMTEAYEYTGIGTVVDGDGVVFSVQLFATKSGYDSRTAGARAAAR